VRSMPTVKPPGSAHSSVGPPRICVIPILLLLACPSRASEMTRPNHCGSELGTKEWNYPLGFDKATPRDA
jgi:hypothetical protein